MISIPVLRFIRTFREKKLLRKNNLENISNIWNFCYFLEQPFQFRTFQHGTPTQPPLPTNIEFCRRSHVVKSWFLVLAHEWISSSFVYSICLSAHTVCIYIYLCPISSHFLLSLRIFPYLKTPYLLQIMHLLCILSIAHLLMNASMRGYIKQIFFCKPEKKILIQIHMYIY